MSAVVSHTIRRTPRVTYADVTLDCGHTVAVILQRYNPYRNAGQRPVPERLLCVVCRKAEKRCRVAKKPLRFCSITRKAPR